MIYKDTNLMVGGSKMNSREIKSKSNSCPWQLDYNHVFKVFVLYFALFNKCSKSHAAFGLYIWLLGR